MKTIEEVKNEVAVKHGYESWVLLFSADRISLLGYVNEAMQLYAEQMCKRQRELCKKQYQDNQPSALKWIGNSIDNAPLATEE